jgi:hypothetical protein
MEQPAKLMTKPMPITSRTSAERVSPQLFALFLNAPLKQLLAFDIVITP